MEKPHGISTILPAKDYLSYRLSFAIGSILLYAIIFFLLHFVYHFTAMPMVAVFPVMVIAWLYGPLIGVIAGILSFPFNVLMFIIAGISLVNNMLMTGPGIAGTIAYMIIALIVGRLSDLGQRLKKELRARQSIEEELQQHRESLEKLVSNKTGELQASQERFRAIAENSPDTIIITDSRGVIIYCNSSSEIMFGYDPKELLGQHTSILLPQPLRESETTRREQFLQSADFESLCRTIQTTGVRKDGTEFFIEFPFFSWKADNEIFFTAIIRDITQRKNFEKALNSERERLAEIIATSPVIICGITANGTTSFINKAGEEITGYSNQELTGLNWWATFYPGALHAQVEDLFSLLAQGDVVNHEMSLQTKPGELRMILWNSIKSCDSQGTLLELVGFGHDITERKQAENKVRQARDFLENIFRASPEAIIVTDSYGYIIMANESVCSVYGYHPEELVGQHASVFATDDEAMTQKTFAMMEELYEKGLVRNFTIDRRHKDGHTIQTESSIMQMKDADGTPSGGISSSRDITDRKILEEQLRQSQKMEAIGTLAGGIAHDFNNILAAIMGYTELSKDLAAGNSVLEKNLSHVLKSVDRAKALVRQILTFSRKTEGVVKPLRLHLVIEEAFKLLRASLPSTISIRSNIHDTDDVVVADATEIHRIVMNLCTNAAYAMQTTGGVLDITLNPIDIDIPAAGYYVGIAPGPYVQLSVKDTGMGIPRDVIGRIFEPFFTTKEIGKGTGMGLAMVHGIVKSLKGDIKVYSEPGKGAVFHVVLPRVQAEKIPADAVEREAPQGQESVLLVDDEAVLLDVGEQLLNSLGYRVTAISSPVEALELFGKNPAAFDLVITDQTMPQLTGYELAQQLLKIRKDVPLILCTGYSDLVTAESASAGGIEAFVMKPLNRLAIAETIRKVLDKSAA